MNNKQSSDSDISNGGALLALNGIGLNFNTAKAEAKENQIDQNNKNSRTIYDPINKLLIEIDDGLHGANNERLKKMSTLHCREKSSTQKHGMHNMGSKAYTAYNTQLFKNESSEDLTICDNIKEILQKPEKTPIEKLKISPTVISLTDQYDEFNERPLNQITLDFIGPIYEGKPYKNDPKEATPVNTAIWEKLSINPEKPGTIIITPVADKIHREILSKISTPNVDENHLIFLSKTYNEYLKNGIKMSFELATINITQKDGEIKVDKIPLNFSDYCDNSILQTNILRATSFDPLHYDNDKIESFNKTEKTIQIYESSNPNIKIDNEKKLLVLVVYDKKITKVIKNIKGKNVSVNIRKDELNNEISGYTLKTTITLRCTFSDNWKDYDKEIIKDIFGNSDNFTNLDSLNGTNIGRNNKITDKLKSEHKNSGDYCVRRAYSDSRFMIKFNADMDKYEDPLLLKSQTNYDKWPAEIRDAIEWAMKAWKDKIGEREKKLLKKKKNKEENNDKKLHKEEEKQGEEEQDEEQSTDKEEKQSEEEQEQSTDKDEEQEQSEEEQDEEQEQSEEEQDEEQEQSTDKDKDEEKQSEEKQSEEEQDEEQEQSTDKDEEKQSEEEILPSSSTHIPDISPKPVSRNANNAKYINKKQLFEMIDYMYKNEHLHDKLNLSLINLYKVNQLIELSIFNDIYNCIQLKEKVNIIKIYLNKKYSFDIDTVHGGSAFYNENKDIFEQN